MNPPQETFMLDSYAFHWKEEGVEVVIDRLHEERDGLKCEMSISTSRPPTPGLLREGRFNLSSPTTRGSWVKALEARMGEIDWYATLEIVCAHSIRRWRQGEPLVDLAQVDVPDDLPYLLHPLVIDGASSVLFADGGAGKSLVALAAAVSVATGSEVIPGIVPQRCGPVIYWDWEWDAESHAERLQAICAGAGIDVPEGLLFYQRELASVLESIPRMRKRVAETGAVFVVADSLGFARGGEPNSADLTTRMFTSFRTLAVPVLALDHVAKDKKEDTHSFGSTYTFNAARMMWRIDVQKEEGRREFYAALVNTKANRQTQKSRGLSIRLTTDEDERLLAVNFEATDIRDIPGLNKTLSLRDQIEGVIRANFGRSLTPRDIALVLEEQGTIVTENVVRVTLNKHKKRFVRHGEGWAVLAQSEGA